jgi:anion-transporting  ArsA/GET3 family ATPase
LPTIVGTADGGRIETDWETVETLLDRKLLVISGKGGVGKTTMSAALGLLAAEGGRRTTIVEFGEQSRLAALFDKEPADPGFETRLAPRLSSISIDPDRALLEWLQALGGRVSGRILASSGTFQYFAAAAPGAREIVSMVKIWQLTQGSRRGHPGADLVILDAPATGHALGMLRSPKTFGAIARVGPIVRQTKQVQELLGDPARTDYVAVALGTELAVTETIEFQEGLRNAVGREPAAVLVNGLVPRRFNGAEMERIEGLLASGAQTKGRSNGAAPPGVVFDAVAAAREAHEQARVQQSQIARLRRRGFHVIGVPFVWTPELELDGIRTLAQRLGRATD